MFSFDGKISKAIFAIGIGLLAIPVMASDCGYILSDVFRWKRGLSKKFNQAKAFYIVISLSVISGLGINLLNLNLIMALVYANIINGIVAIPILIAIVRIANDKNILGIQTNGKISNIIGWSTVAVTGMLFVFMLLSLNM